MKWPEPKEPKWVDDYLGSFPAYPERVAVWFSCGAASAAAAYYTLQDHSDKSIRILNNPIAEEDDDNRRFLSDVQDWLGVPIEPVISPEFPSQSCEEVWQKRKFMSGPLGAPCTVSLKKRARQTWEMNNKPHWHVLGFTADEKTRHDRFVLGERDNVLPVLINRGLTKQQCYYFLELHGIKPPRTYAQGYPNANCIGCVKATSPTYWNHVRKVHPDVFARRAEQSRSLGAKLVRVNNERIFLDELDPKAKGRPMKTIDFECGLFCEES